jgi:hypothetical protein
MSTQAKASGTLALRSINLEWGFDNKMDLMFKCMPLFLLPKFDRLNSDFIHKEEYIQVWLMMINATFNNASVTNVSRGDQFYCCIGYTSPWAGFELATLKVIGSDCIGSCKSNYHTITTTTAPHQLWCQIIYILNVNVLAKIYRTILNEQLPWRLKGYHI